jgi:multiple sugar transport system permease protein
MIKLNQANHQAKNENILGWALALPASFLLVMLYLLPITWVILMSLTNYELGAISFDWVGLRNFSKALEDEVFLRSFRNTLLYVALVLPSSIFLGLGIAVLIHARKRTRSIYEVIYFLPVTSTLIAMATVFQFLLHPKLGPVNHLLTAIGIEAISFISDPQWVIPTLAMILFLAGLSSIPEELYEAAALDGANGPIDRFVRITWPMLGPTTLFVMVTSCITAFKIFDTVATLTQGKSGSEVLLYALYLEGFQYFKMGYAAALTLVFLFFILILSIVQSRLIEKKVHYV